MLLPQFPSTFLQIQKWMPPYCTAYDNFCANWDSLCDHLRDVHLEDVFKLGGSAGTEFCEWVQVRIDVYIPHHKYQVKLHSSPSFSAARAAVIAHRNHVYCLYE